MKPLKECIFASVIIIPDYMYDGDFIFGVIQYGSPVKYWLTDGDVYSRDELIAEYPQVLGFTDQSMKDFLQEIFITKTQ